MRLRYVGSQSKANSDVAGAVVESQAATGQWKCVQPVTAVVTESSRALYVASLRLLVTACLSDAVATLSHVDSLVADGPVGQSVA